MREEIGYLYEENQELLGKVEVKEGLLRSLK